VGSLGPGLSIPGETAINRQVVARERLIPGTLSRDRIIDVALKLAEREGLPGLSMRRIAAELGTGAMSLYNHVPDKAALLAGVAERVLSEVELPAGASWVELARSWSTSLRGTLLAHHSIGPIVISADEAGPLIRTNHALVEALQRADLSKAEARRVMRSVGRLVAGSVFLDATALGWVYDEETREHLDRHFEYGLDALIDGLGRRIEADRACAVGETAEHLIVAADAPPATHRADPEPTADHRALSVDLTTNGESPTAKGENGPAGVTRFT
jgi:TetR/AcrR family tetracycline transcriptional repressor